MSGPVFELAFYKVAIKDLPELTVQLGRVSRPATTFKAHVRNVFAVDDNNVVVVIEANCFGSGMPVEILESRHLRDLD